MTEFAGRTVLVTGASRGIGLATAKRFVAEGAQVGLVAREADRLASVASELGEACVAVPADLRDAQECVRVVREVSQALGAVDVLVSNAGVLRRDFIDNVKVDDFEDSYRLGVGAALWLAQQVIPTMRARGYGRIVLVSSEQLSPILWLKIFTLINPLVYVSEGLRAAMTPGLPHMPIPVVLAALVATTATLGWLGTRSFVRRVTD